MEEHFDITYAEAMELVENDEDDLESPKNNKDQAGWSELTMYC